MTAEFAIALCQYALGSADSLPDLCTRAERLFDEAGDADLYVLPELLVCDVTVEREDASAAETALGPERQAAYHDFLRSVAAARDAAVVGGSYNVIEDDGIVNRLPLATPDDLCTYDKRHPTPEERDSGKRPGDAAPPVVEHRGVGVGVLNCYDVEFPETARDLAARGAEIVAVPSWTGDEAGFQRVRRCAMARAVENQCYVAQVPLVGARHGAEGTGRAAVFAPCDDVVGPHGTRLSLPRDVEASATCRVDVEALRRSRAEAAVRPYTDACEVFR
jgi:predicted amidohydrolase